MNRSSLAVLSLTLAAVAAFLVLSLPADIARAAGTKRVVPDDYPTIQAAVDAAVAGDTVEIRSGLYGETVEVEGRTDLTIVAKKGAGIGSGGSLYLKGCTRVQVVGLSILDSSYTAITADDCTDLIISGCRIDTPFDDGILTIGCTNVLITKCSITDARERGICDEMSENVRILKNVVRSTWFGSGICLSPYLGEPGTMLALVAGNQVFDAGDQGISVAGTDIRVEKNLVDLVTNHGIIVDNSMECTGVAISKNTVRNALYGIRLDGLGCEAVGNKVYTSAVSGLVVRGREHLVTKNALVGAGTGLQMEADGSEVLKNKVSGASSAGIRVTGNDNLFEKNSAVGNGPPDFVDEGSGNTIGKNKFGTVGP